MITNKVRFILIALAVVLLAWTITKQEYQASALVALGILLLIISYLRDGTVVLAARSFQRNDYDKTEKLLQEIKYPERLRAKRRGYYEFIYGNIELKRLNYEEAERHFQIASRFPLRNGNDKAYVMVHLANLSLRKHESDRAEAYLVKARELKTSSRVKDIILKIEKEIQKRFEQ
ncbi:tetratricopeptide repeat protein [Arcticibacter eurypsychrophilus]|uniref:hypothetical protein n=1 Tax=Arcticibacter eurypsychrophilus TaxID=1434752 RepID=UPI0009F3C717|nr:hypothetical protein [Arcticibacter eurypsychrophilus]